MSPLEWLAIAIIAGLGLALWRQTEVTDRMRRERDEYFAKVDDLSADLRRAHLTMDRMVEARREG